MIVTNNEKLEEICNDGSVDVERRQRLAEETARQTARSEQLRDAEARLQKSESLLGKCTSDYVALRHEMLERHRADTETVESLSVEV